MWSCSILQDHSLQMGACMASTPLPSFNTYLKCLPLWSLCSMHGV